MGKSRLPGFTRNRLPEILATLSRFSLAAVFLYAGVPKLLNWPNFSEAVSRYHLLPLATVPAFSLLLASLELVLGFFLLTGVHTRISAWLTIFLNILFIFAMGQALIRGIDTSCGCFSASENPLTFIDILRDIIFILMAGFVIWMEKEKWHPHVKMEAIR